MRAIELIKAVLERNYISDLKIQEEIIHRLLEIYGPMDSEEEEIIISRVSGFIYTYMKKNLCSQDELAWRIFISIFSGIFHKKLMEMEIKSEEDRNEIIQEFFYHIMKKCRDGKFNPEKEAKNAFMSYILTAFVRSAINQLKRRYPERVRSMEELAEIHPSFLIPHPGFLGCEKLLYIMESNNFSKEDVEIIRLKCEGYRQKEISYVLGKSEAYISRRFKAIVRKLKKIISGPDELLYG